MQQRERPYIRLMAGKKHDAIHIREAIQAMLQSQQLKPRFDEASVVAAWELIVGKAVARQTRRVSIRDKVLFVELLSPSFKNDLSYHKAAILERLEKQFGSGVVKEIIIM